MQAPAPAQSGEPSINCFYYFLRCRSLSFLARYCRRKRASLSLLTTPFLFMLALVNIDESPSDAHSA